ncbi:hypothetical protein B0H15DRAFT_954040 [Mycena belliarum]|uniref:Uncharacterized protein n=1 Tax=Mycena belliarum TaxID=1033014 RepID=A0AAD6XPU1_9AGAR|nr:hypothetical protein B0H15DRAFT_954040 [Mycena belliae]
MPPVTRLSGRGPKHEHAAMNDAVWRNDDLLLACLRYLDFLDLMAFSYTAREFATFVKGILRSRIRRYTRPFFPSTDSLHLFFLALEATQSWIVGSVALAAVSVLSDVPVPNNLNIISTCHQVKQWVTFLVDVCHFEERQRVMCRGAYAHVGSIYAVFVHPARQELSITLTTSSSSSTAILFLAAPNTNQQIAISAHRIITPYVELMAAQQALKGWRPRQQAAGYIVNIIGHGTYHETTPFPGAVRLLESEAERGRRCGWACPAIHRNARGLVGIGHWNWGGMDGKDLGDDRALTEMGVSGVTFHLGRMTHVSHLDSNEADASPTNPTYNHNGVAALSGFEDDDAVTLVEAPHATVDDAVTTDETNDAATRELRAFLDEYNDISFAVMPSSDRVYAQNFDIRGLDDGMDPFYFRGGAVSNASEVLTATVSASRPARTAGFARVKRVLHKVGERLRRFFK